MPSQSEQDESWNANRIHFTAEQERLAREVSAVWSFARATRIRLAALEARVLVWAVVIGWIVQWIVKHF